eukprot:GFUD01043962.1.p1 GENE.GFUD01043962.1~~GFUD01043962.1.p1  ORF type:complete len:1237 (+),score=200.38 GFUD01043962.1:169-3879(+)
MNKYEGLEPQKTSHHNLDYFYNLVYKTIIYHQDPVTGLLPAHQISGCEEHAWIRDNVYSIISVWALAMAYQRQDQDEEKARSFLLEKSTVKCMRGILVAMLAQREKVEKFKVSFSKKDSLHAKYCSKTGLTVVGDDEWGHLQIDAVSLYLLSLAQMTAGGLQIIFTLDEVAFVQNLVFYIECAYATPDYGVWERGAKSNQGILELNASSIGMAKAALEAMNKLDLFGGNGSPASVIHTLPDEAVRCAAVLESMLPRESNSKETDAAILGIIGYPAFAVTNSKLIEETLETIQTKLGGRYGMKRFLRDGYKTLKEDTGRLHYEPWELRVFDNIECEWPLFFCFMAINNIFNGNLERAIEYTETLEGLTVATSGMKLLPELYIVPEENMSQEYASPGTTDRTAGGRCPFMWAQSLHVIAKLLQDDFLAPAELDPMNRRLCFTRKPDVVVQVVVLAEDTTLQMQLADQGIMLQTCQQISPIEVKPAQMLSHLYSFLGRSKRLGLSGRKNPDVGILTTSKIYRIQNKTFVFTPQSFDRSTNYIDTDPSLAMSTLAYSLNYLSTSWMALGRPTLTLILNSSMLEEGRVPPPIVNTLKKLSGGYINGTRVILGTHEQFKPTSCFSELAFLGNIEDGMPDKLDPQVVKYLESQLGTGSVKEGILGKLYKEQKRHSSSGSNVTISLTGSMKRSRSICPDLATSREIAKQLSEIAAMEEEDDQDGNSANFSSFFIGESDSVKTRISTASAHISKESSIDEDHMILPSTRRTRFETESQFEDTEVQDLVDMLSSTNDMEIHGDILHYMVATYGMQFQTGEGNVKDLLRELYESACIAKHWGIVRHTNGLLDKKMPNLALSLTDLIVRQKQVTVGLPPDNEIIISQPLGGSELRDLISKASEGDMSAATLTQEILIYLAMFIRTEPNLFHGMLRLRVGLILQVMASEMSRTLGIPGEEATDKLLNLSPFETKNLLHHIMSGEEYHINDMGSKTTIVAYSCQVKSRKQSHYPVDGVNQRQMSIFPQTLDTLRQRHRSNESIVEPDQSVHFGSNGSLDQIDDEEPERTGMWTRRRLLDGSLNRVPPGFYTRMWSLLEKCQGISVYGKILNQSITQEMTSGEMKFHLRCEALLNTVPEPEFRQLVVEAILILILSVEHSVVPYLGGVIIVDDIVRTANLIFLKDQEHQQGDATLCCSEEPGKCEGEAGICVHFYDSAPSGPYGTMSYLVRATCKQLNTIPDDGEIDCTLM